jgi:hypothetical protein
MDGWVDMIDILIRDESCETKKEILINYGANYIINLTLVHIRPEC